MLADETTIDELNHANPNFTRNAEPAWDDDQWFGLVPWDQLILVRPYTDDADDQLLADIRPRFIIMFEPSEEFIRRVEVSR